jgi:hypothetical protein
MHFHRQEHHSRRIPSGLRQTESKLIAFTGKKLVWDLNQDARAIARFGIASASTAMRQVDEHLETFLDNRVALLSANARDKTHAAGVVFIQRIVEALRIGKSNLRTWVNDRGVASAGTVTLRDPAQWLLRLSDDAGLPVRRDGCIRPKNKTRLG